MRRPLSIACLLCAVALRPAMSADVAGEAVAPPGFEPVALEEIGGRFLVPDRWRTSVAKGKLMSSLAVHERPLPADGTAAARLTVDVVSNLTKTNFRLVSEQLGRYAEDLARAGGVDVLEHEPLHRDGYVGVSLLLAHPAPAGGEALHERRFYLADDRRDWLVVVGFRAPARRWESLRALREVLLERFVLG